MFVNQDGYIVHRKLYSINNSYVGTVGKQYVSHKSPFLNEIIIILSSFYK